MHVGFGTEWCGSIDLRFKSEVSRWKETRDDRAQELPVMDWKTHLLVFAASPVSLHGPIQIRRAVDMNDDVGQRESPTWSKDEK